MAKPEQWRKKSVVIEAIQWTGGNAVTLLDWIKPEARQEGAVIVIPTLEGDHEASLGDWIIKGVAGEFYPCKPDIFTMTYERASPAMTDLLPCPFCGHRAETQQYGLRTEAWAVWCVECNAQMESISTEAEAITAWNRRALPAVTPAPTLAEAAKVLADAIDRMTDAEYLDAAYELDKALQTHDRGKAASALRRIAEARHD